MFLGLSRRHLTELRLVKLYLKDPALHYIYYHLERGKILLCSAGSLQQMQQGVNQRVTEVNFKALHVGKFYPVLILCYWPLNRNVLQSGSCKKESKSRLYFFSHFSLGIFRNTCSLNQTRVVFVLLWVFLIHYNAARVIPCNNSDKIWKGNKDLNRVLAWLAFLNIGVFLI